VSLILLLFLVFQFFEASVSICLRGGCLCLDLTLPDSQLSLPRPHLGLGRSASAPASTLKNASTTSLINSSVCVICSCRELSNFNTNYCQKFGFSYSVFFTLALYKLFVCLLNFLLYFLPFLYFLHY